MVQRERKRGLVLSGGGGRGAYHVGVLRFLKEHEWFPGVIVAPRRPIPVDQIGRYTESGRQSVNEMGYDDARRAGRESGRPVEVEG